MIYCLTKKSYTTLTVHLMKKKEKVKDEMKNNNSQYLLFIYVKQLQLS